MSSPWYNAYIRKTLQEICVGESCTDVGVAGGWGLRGQCSPWECSGQPHYVPPLVLSIY